MRFIIKLAILGLAAFGAQRLYAELSPRLGSLSGRARDGVSEAVETVSSVAEDVKQDVKIAAMQVKDDLAAPAQDLRASAAELGDAVREAR